MAYSNYGAYIWKNGKEVTSICADKVYLFKEGAWRLKTADEENEDLKEVFAHAVLPLDNTVLLEFYKNCYLNIYIDNKKENIDLEKKVWSKVKYTHRATKVNISGYALDLEESIYFYEIKYKNDTWCVVIGSSFGAGYDHYAISKYVKKHLEYVFDNGASYYYINHKSEYEFDYYCRLSTIQHVKETRWLFGIKPLLSDIFKLRWYNIAYDISNIIEDNIDIKFLK